jgi:Cd2+/Zn2+-exporting ATPase
VLSGISFVDMSALTGESIPKEVEPGSEVLSGSINATSLLEVKVSKEFQESTVARILDLVQNAAAKKAPTENFITTFARYYTPAVVIMAAAIAFVPPLVLGSAFAEWINRALVFLVVSCPCALVISIPLGFFGGIGASSKKGILVKGGSFLEALNRVDTVVFDKTGTLTKGIFEVEEIVPHNEFSKEKLLEYTALAEHFSNHPLATAINRAYPCQVSRDMYEEYSEISGRGVRAVVNGTAITAGNIKLMKDEGISIAENNFSDTVIHVAVNKKYAGFIRISDQIKTEAKQTISDLKEMGIRRIVMLSGDHDKVVQKVGRELGMD